MNILVVSKFYPPMTAARALQIMKVTAAMQNAGATVHVIAGQECPSSQRNENHHGKQEDPEVMFVPFTPMKGKSLPSRMLAKARRELPLFLVFRAWIGNAMKKAEMVISRSKVDLIMTSSTPLESHMVGL